MKKMLGFAAVVTSGALLASSGIIKTKTHFHPGEAAAVANALTAPSVVSSAMAMTDPSVAADPNVFVKLAKKIVPSVVNISSIQLAKAPDPGQFQGRMPFQGGPEDMFREFFEEFAGRGQNGGMPQGRFQRGMPPGPRQGRNPYGTPRAMSLGTGFVIDGSGIILTNNHVVAGADEIKINFTESSSEKPTEGKVIGRDPELDVALIRVNTTQKLVPLALGDSDALDVGEYVAAVGNPFGQGHSISHGIVSAKGRQVPGLSYATYLQTDAPINPGNSGGPLVNLKGEVIGINNAIDARAQGIGFAIPINVVKKELAQLKSDGKVARGYLGVMVGDLNPEVADQFNGGSSGMRPGNRSGAYKDLTAPLITQVVPQGPADLGGLKPYDVITEVNGKAIHSAAELTTEVSSLPVGEKLKLKILRDGKTSELNVRTGERPAVDT